MSNYNRGAVLISGSGEHASSGRYTGSFARLLALPTSGSTEGSNSTMCVIDRIDFGQYAQHGGTHTIYNVINKTFAVHSGTTIEGPIVQLKIASGSFLAYKNS
jgi:hypothetical protein